VSETTGARQDDRTRLWVSPRQPSVLIDGRRVPSILTLIFHRCCGVAIASIVRACQTMWATCTGHSAVEWGEARQMLRGERRRSAEPVSAVHRRDTRRKYRRGGATPTNESGERRLEA
jgi:hypothetical protein